MIAKCIAILAVVAQIVSGQTSVVVSGGPASPVSQVAMVSSGCSSGAGAVTRNLVAKGKYPVALKNCGPTPDQQIPVTTSRVTAPLQEKPTIRLPARIPAPRVVSHSCTCYKTVLRPRVHQQIITVPSVQRYIETTHKPVIEQIQYEAVPVNCQAGSSGSAQLVALSSGPSNSESVELISGSPVQAIQVPAPQVQVVETPRVQVVEAQSVQIPQTVSFGSSTSC